MVIANPKDEYVGMFEAESLDRYIERCECTAAYIQPRRQVVELTTDSGKTIFIKFDVLLNLAEIIKENARWIAKTQT